MKSDAKHEPSSFNRIQLLPLMVGALGIVFGDIGTSPLYTVRACFPNAAEAAPAMTEVLGVISLIIWSLIVIVAIKYLSVILKADLNGEGGILALMALVTSAKPMAPANRWLIPLGLFGAALLFGDGIITPAMSVISAVEGMEVASPKLASLVVPVSCTILLVLFLLQRRGTTAIGAWFGPVMLLWFAAIALLGVGGIWSAPEVLRALDPTQGVSYFVGHLDKAFFILGFVFLAVTGGEALYADLGHFGRPPIRLGWFAVVFPALTLNYLGQGGLILSDPTAAGHSFYRLAPDWCLYPLILLATTATVIASQAILSGAFSLAHQARQLGFLPNIQISHYSDDGEGKVYVPLVNWALAIATIVLVISFRSSDALAGAYGMAVAGTMLITTVLAITCFWRIWHWPLVLTILAASVFLSVDTTFFLANLAKLFQGGWIPLSVAAGVYLIMSTWRTGREAIERSKQVSAEVTHELLQELNSGKLTKVPGTAVYFASNATTVPLTLIANAQHNHVLHEQVVLLTIVTQHTPRVPPDQRLTAQQSYPGFVRLIANYGFMQTPHVPTLIRQAVKQGLLSSDHDITYFVRSEAIELSKQHLMASWRKRLYAVLSRNSQDVSNAWSLPPEKTIGIRLPAKL